MTPQRSAQSSTAQESIAFEFHKAGSLESLAPQDIIERARSVQASIPDGTTFVLRADDDGVLHSHVVFPARSRGSKENLAFQISAVIAAKSTPCEVPDLADVSAVAGIRVDLQNPVAGDVTQAGTEFGGAVKMVSGNMQRNEWLAVSVRTPSRSEQRRNSTWRTKGRNQSTHQSFTAGAKVASVWAGSFDRDSAKNLAAIGARAMPGFDVNVDGVSVPSRFALSPKVGVGVALTLVGAAASALPMFLPEFAFIAEMQPWWLWGLGAGASVGAIGVGQKHGFLPSNVGSLIATLRRGQVPEPAKLLRTPKPPVREKDTIIRNPDGTTHIKRTDEYQGDYPLHHSGALVGPHLPLSLIAPHVDSKFASRSTTARTAPAALRAPIGPVVVADSDGNAHVSAADAWSGTFVTGQAGSGKTHLLEAIWGWYCLQLSRPPAHRAQGVPDRTSMIAFDTKTDAAAADNYTAWAQRFGVPLRRFDVADQDAPDGIALFEPISPGRSAASYGNDVVDSLSYAYGADAIGNRSRPSLVAAFAAAALLADRPALVEPVAAVESGRSAFYYANILIGNRDDSIASELAASIAQARTLVSGSTNDPDLVEVAELLEPLYGPGLTPAFRRNLFDAPRSKVSPLLQLDHWWSRPNQITWDRLLEEQVPTVVNFGRDRQGRSVADGASGQMAALAMHTMYRAIKRTCAGWQSQGRQIAPFADEVKHLAAHSSDVLAWFRNDGRSFGVAPYFATQFPEQLDDTLRKTMNGYGTRIMFAQNDESVIRQLVANLSTEGSDWRAEDIAMLPRFHAIVKTVVEQTPLPAFVGAVPAFANMSMEQFIAVADGDTLTSTITDSESTPAPQSVRPTPQEIAAAAHANRIEQMRSAAAHAEQNAMNWDGTNQ